MPARPGQRLCIHHAPRAGAVRGKLVYVHPLAEEMNKSRRMAALQSRALAAAGYALAAASDFHQSSSTLSQLRIGGPAVGRPTGAARCAGAAAISM